MAELRWNPLLRTYTMVAGNRQKRPHMPQDWCPFCPGEGKNVPDNYTVFKYDNDFPTLKQNPDIPELEDDDLYRIKENYGKCEVILYSPDHNVTLPQLSLEHIKELIDLWQERNNDLSKDEKIKYVFPFENRGKEVGVTMPHPHGQLYAYSWIPLKIKAELDSCKEYYNKNKKCLLCEMNKKEKNFEKRILIENNNFISYLPFFTDYPYGAFIVSKNHKSNLSQFNDNEKRDLAEILKYLTGGFDNIFDKIFPYMMVVHQSPVNSNEYKDSHKYFHFHIEFYPPLRDKDRIKWYASSEMGAWAATNTLLVEDTAEILRNNIKKFKDLL
ncbi:galactose-1-phosphate uridylyltransferase [Oceanotoga teriensis]|jgi:UDPglucose--hexose-1-phosphate uridylyltransferase|uniref:Galactose-1-phosphate uridylyltransferase n=1 Tax=Oceanotoga teriensis TaxID=515440 RepID=A0AA45C8B2_9BACT|nr:galactose-1-phosphate uridylyltransferase [Oceanotoga teriensis]MDO7976816.1 galactose-1-phosphate uridylyltransferase [Oceanotoga teriensis]PWJ95892.1 UDPglucose--hexose-1-phosphate uridylyltransferase [Oceanotoga teriensis]